MISVNEFKHMALKEAQSVAAGIGLGKSAAQPDELLLLAQLTATDSEYVIQLDAKIQNNVWSGASGLDFRNGFKAAAMAVGILPAKVASGITYFGAQLPIYWEDPAVFDTAASAVLTESQAVAGVYMGDITLKTNEGIRMDKHKLIQFRHVPQTQHGTVITNDGNTTPAVSTVVYHNQQNGDEVRSLGGIMTFLGGDDSEVRIRVECQDKSELDGPATRNNYLAIRFVGATIKGLTTAMLNK